MRPEHTGNVLNQLFKDVFQKTAIALRVIPVGFDGTDYPEIRTLPDGTLVVTGTVGGTVTIPHTVNVVGTVTVPHVVNILGTVTVPHTVNVLGTVTIPHPVAVTGTVTIPHPITGTVTIPHVVGITGTVTVPHIVNIIGTVTIPHTLDVTGTVTVPHTVNVVGTVTIPHVVNGVVTIPHTVFVMGPVAHDAAATLNPVVIGGRANDTAPVKVSTAGDAGIMWQDRFGRPVVLVGSPGATRAYSSLVPPASVLNFLPNPGLTSALYLHSMILSNADGAGILEFREGGSTVSPLFLTVALAAQGGNLSHQFQTYIKLDTNTACSVTGQNIGLTGADFRFLIEYHPAVQ